jgi:hypothetical protein
MLDSVLRVPGLRGLILETFGSGTAPGGEDGALISIFRAAVARGIVIVNVSQCQSGSVSALYAPATVLGNVGVVFGQDLTTEAALTKLSFLLAMPELDYEDVTRQMEASIRGEMTEVSGTLFVSFPARSSPTAPPACPFVLFSRPLLQTSQPASLTTQGPPRRPNPGPPPLPGHIHSPRPRHHPRRPPHRARAPRHVPAQPARGRRLRRQHGAAPGRRGPQRGCAEGAVEAGRERACAQSRREHAAVPGAGRGECGLCGAVGGGGRVVECGGGGGEGRRGVKGPGVGCRLVMKRVVSGMPLVVLLRYPKSRRAYEYRASFKSTEIYTTPQASNYHPLLQHSRSGKFAYHSPSNTHI